MKTLTQNTIIALIIVLGSTTVSAQVDSTLNQDSIVTEQELIVEEVMEIVNEVISEISQELGDTMKMVDENISHVPDYKKSVMIDKHKVKVVISDKDSTGEDGIIEEIILSHSDEEEEEEERFKIVTTDQLNMQFGLNNLINRQGEFEMPQGFEALSLNPTKSFNFHLHFVQQALNIYKDHVRLLYGIGMDFNNYRFENNILISGTDNGLEISPSSIDYKKNKLTTNHLTMPLLLNLQFGQDSKKFSIAGGLNMGYLINGYQRLKWKDNDGKHKVKREGDYGLTDYRIGYELQFGYGKLNFYGKYFPESIFKASKGPDLRSVSFGIILGNI